MMRGCGMNKQEIRKWIRGAMHKDIINENVTKHGNEFHTGIYEKDGKNYAIDFCNGEVKEKWGSNGYIRGEYEVKEVKRKTRMVEEVYYEGVKEE